MIYNPYFEQAGIDAVVMPMGVKAEDYRGVLASLFKLTNIRGALVTMPTRSRRQASSMKSPQPPGLPARATPSCAGLMGACWAICSMVRVSCAESCARASISQARARWSWAAVVWGRLFQRRSLRRESPQSVCSMPTRHLRKSWRPACAATIQRSPSPPGRTTHQLRPRGQCDAHGHERATRCRWTCRGSRRRRSSEVVMKQEMTAFLRAAQAAAAASGGADMLFEQIPAYLEFSASRAPRRKSCVRSPSCAIDRATVGIPIALTRRRPTKR